MTVLNSISEYLWTIPHLISFFIIVTIAIRVYDGPVDMLNCLGYVLMRAGIEDDADTRNKRWKGLKLFLPLVAIFFIELIILDYQGI